MTNQKSALIVGATSGIGMAIAHRFGREGFHVGVMGRNQAAAHNIVASIEATGGSAHALIADVRDRGAMESCISRFIERAGGLDVAVSAAGIVNVGPTAEMPVQQWDDVLAVNLTGVFHLSQLTIKHLCARRGTFLAIGSAGGTFAAQEMAAYCASKAAIHMFVKAIALEYGHAGLRANVIAPGFVRTPMSDGMLKGITPTQLESFEKRAPVGRFAAPDEIADAAFYLASERAAFATGMVYALDGGVTAGWYVPV